MELFVNVIVIQYFLFQFTDSFHPNSLGRIAELEAPIQRADPLPDKEKELPKIVKALPPTIDSVHESQTLHLEAQVTPIDDNTLRVSFFSTFTSRFRILVVSNF